MEFRYDHRADVELDRRIDALLHDVAEAVARDARDNCPRSEVDDTDHVHTADTIRAVANFVIVGDGISPLWFWLEYGTRSHDIWPRRPKFALWWDGLDHPVGRVHHPGTREYAYMRHALYQRRRVLI